MFGFVDFETLQVHRIVERRFELLGTQVQRIHLALGIPQRQFGRRKLQHIARVTR